jgi:hypothetical protein
VTYWADLPVSERSIFSCATTWHTRGSVVGRSNMLRVQAGRSWVRFPMMSLDFSIDLIFQPHYGSEVDSASGRMNTTSLPGGKERPAHKADNLSAICDATYSCPYHSYARTMGITFNSLPLLSLRCSLSPWSWAPSLVLHCNPSLARGCWGVTWEVRRIVVAGASKRERSGLIGFCSLLVEVSSYPGSYGRIWGRAGRFVCYSHVHH